MTAKWRHRWQVLAYLALLAYGTLYPLRGVDWSAPVQWSRLWDWRAALATWSLSDVVVNLLVYVPLGWLLIRAVTPRGFRAALALAALVGAAWSTTLEALQLYIPGRVTSFGDILFNTLGTAAGAVTALLVRTGPVGAIVRQGRARYLRPGAWPELGAAVLGLWALSQLTPLVPSLDPGNLWHGVKPVWRALQSPSELVWTKATADALDLFALGLVVRFVLQPALPGRRIAALVLAAVLALKVPVVGRQLTAEALLGLAAAVGVLGLVGGPLPGRGWAWVGIAALFGARALEALAIGTGPSLATHPFNWMPFAGQQGGLGGLIDLLLGIWPYLGSAFFARLLFPRARAGLWLGLAVVGVWAFFLEWKQQSIPGRYADVTDVLMALLGWWWGWRWGGGTDGPPPTPASVPQAPSGNRFRLGWMIGAGLLGAVLLGGFVASRFQVRAVSFDDAGERLLPRPDQLPPPDLPAFRFRHPRLPAPSETEIWTLRHRHPEFLRVQRRRAGGGGGDFRAVALVGLVSPDAIDFDRVVRRLLALKFTFRGHEQAMPLAQLYDWLYPHFTPAQRAALQDKLAEGCDYLINVIRRKALSPYNVYLYNQPFQALMATAIALYGDHPQGEACMAFAHDLWKHRVLPVWRQVMGRYGGWHEGGEYVGIGIGKAVYSVPAMWRRATGEDLFRREPGIRGFLDFLVYRYRPDETQMRWGDASAFRNRVPERFALALEYRQRAAYAFFGCRPAIPTAWPWGPLPDPALCDRNAVAALPWRKRFDGIGMVIARSDWSRDATYMTFKAGDNYWSHSHLDQGSFTLYKGGPLIIDSGLYGPRYGSDHHMNYTYQTVAHNVVTVTDSEDSAPMPGKDKQPPRPIANDGGQRRVGSGWGRRAPIDLQEWREHREHFHTGRIVRYYADDDLVAAVAELTPAYTNRRCGRGKFSARTCRVARYRRTFVYDRRMDVVVVYDDVTATDADFRKRALFHTVERPQIHDHGFTVVVPPKPALGRPGGRVEVAVLFPREAYLNAVGGPGFEFWVDGRNYDEGGEIWRRVAAAREPKPEPGRWRVEVVPPVARERDRFLAVLKPALAGRRNPTVVAPLEEGGTIGCRLAAGGRTVILRFPADRDGVIIAVGGRRIDLTGLE